MTYQHSEAQGDIALQPITTTRPVPAHKSQNPNFSHTAIDEAHMGLDGARSSSEGDDNRRQQHSPMQMALLPKGPREPIIPKRYPYATPLRNLRTDAAPIDCTACGAREVTSLKLIENNTRHLAAVVFTVLCPCFFCIPYFSPWFKDIEHRCGSCRSVVAIYHRTGRTEVMDPTYDHVQEQESEEGLAQLEQEEQSFL